MKKLFSFAIVLAILTSFIGCNNDEQIAEETTNQNCLTDNNIVSINSLSEEMVAISTDNFAYNKNLDNVDFENASIVEYSDVELKGIIADFTDNTNRKFVAYYDEVEKEFGVNYILNITEEENIRTVIISNENESPELTIKINGETNRIIEVNLVNNDKGYSEWVECVSFAWSACQEDPGCAALCNMTAPACLSAIMAGCAVSPIAPAQS